MSKQDIEKAFGLVGKALMDLVGMFEKGGAEVSEDEFNKGFDFLEATVAASRQRSELARITAQASNFSFGMALPAIPVLAQEPVRSSPAPATVRELVDQAYVMARAPKSLAHKAEQRAVGRLVKEAAGDGDSIVFDTPEPPSTLVPMTGEHDASFIDDK